MRTCTSLILVLAALCFAGIAQAAPNGIFSAQFTGQRENVDPIAAFGVFPTAHTHVFACAQNVTPTHTFADYLAGGTNCVETGNHSGYWIIQPEQGGVPLAPDTSKNMLAYYTCMHTRAICSQIAWFPQEFGEISGNANASSAAQNPVFNNGLGGYRCGIGGGAFTATPPATCDTTLVLGVTYGNCRFPDGHTTMQLSGNCTGAGGTPQIRRQQYWRFKPVHPNLSDLTLNGHPTYQLHADIDNGWKPETAQDFLDRFVHPGIAGGQNPPLVG